MNKVLGTLCLPPNKNYLNRGFSPELSEIVYNKYKFTRQLTNNYSI
jgi:hypothetical protein